MTNAAVGTLSKALRKPWYTFWKLVEKGYYRGRDYSVSVPYGYRVFTPWFSTDPRSEFYTLIQSARAAGPLAKSADRCFMLYQLSRSCLRLDGDWAECGVYSGGTAHLLSLIALEHPRPFHLFDTFCGMPSVARAQRDYHAAGEFSDTSLDDVKRRLGNFPFVVLHPGVMPDTFDEVATVASYSFVHVDVDIYPSALACCEWFWPRLRPGGMMVFNDYGIYPYRYAARAAVDEFFAGASEGSLLVLPTGQAIAMKHA